VKDNFILPIDFREGKYVLALALIDPTGNLPAARFAIQNYYQGGRHPIGKVGVGTEIENPELDDFDDIQSDWSLHY
jgi:hypothetical protein